MRRRQFITLLGSAAAAWPLRARAQQPAVPLIGFLGGTTLSGASQWVAAFVQRLRELGRIEGRTVAIEYRWAEGRADRAAEITAEFVRLKVDVIVTNGTPTAIAVKQGTATIPIVVALFGDPVASGLVASLARPGGNLTGLSTQSTDLVGKRIEILREVVPGFHRLAILGNVGSPQSVMEMGDLRDQAHALGIDVVTLEIRRTEDIVPAFDRLDDRADGLYVVADPLVASNTIRINTLALGSRLPTMHASRDYVEAAGLMSYGPNSAALFRHAADLVDKILRGAKPGNIPIEQPTKFDLVVNLVTAKALRLAISATMLTRADEVIE